MVYFDVDPEVMTAAALSRRLEDEYGVRIGDGGGQTLRAVTHLDVDGPSVDDALRALRQVMAER